MLPFTAEFLLELRVSGTVSTPCKQGLGPSMGQIRQPCSTGGFPATGLPKADAWFLITCLMHELRHAAL